MRVNDKIRTGERDADHARHVRLWQLQAGKNP